MRTRVHGLLAGATILATTAGVQAEAPATAEYAAAQAILTAKCVRCHGPEKQKSGLRLDTRSAALEGGIDGPSILPGKSAESDLVRRILGQTKPRMPYKEPPLEAAEIAAIRAWID
ncbi:MAG TPA: c-type cytochrome domain-containing protein, partial [Vicinamibacteria bacterium]